MKIRKTIWFCNTVLMLLGFAASSVVIAQEGGRDEQTEMPHAFNGQPMTAERLGELILNVDEEAVLDSTSWLFHVLELETVVVYDSAADRMRILIPIGSIDELEPFCESHFSWAINLYALDLPRTGLTDSEVEAILTEMGERTALIIEKLRARNLVIVCPYEDA